jgi:hypothetical protein
MDHVVFFSVVKLSSRTAILDNLVAKIFQEGHQIIPLDVSWCRLGLDFVNEFVYLSHDG